MVVLVKFTVPQAVPYPLLTYDVDRLQAEVIVAK